MKSMLRHGVIALASLGPMLCVAQGSPEAAKGAHVVSPAASAGAQASPRLTAMSTPAFQAHASTISTVSQRALTPQVLAKFNAPQRAQLRRSVERLAKANEVFLATEDTMRPKQRLLAELQVELATNALRKTAAVTQPGAPQPTALLQAPVMLTTSAEMAALAVSKPPLDVQVYVQSGDGKPAAEMDVYVLPIGVIEYGVDLEITQIRNVIDGLMFRTPTSPASGDLEPGYVFAVWVGSRHAAGAMARLVKDQTVRYHTIDTRDFNGPFTITFTASEQVVAP